MERLADVFVELFLDLLEKIIVHDHDVQQDIFVDQVGFNDLPKQLLLPGQLVLEKDGEQIFQHFSYIGSGLFLFFLLTSWLVSFFAFLIKNKILVLP